MDKNTKTYLGDGLYAEHDGFGIWLTSENGSNVLDRVYLEPQVYQALLDWVERLKKN